MLEPQWPMPNEKPAINSVSLKASVVAVQAVGVHPAIRGYRGGVVGNEAPEVAVHLAAENQSVDAGVR